MDINDKSGLTAYAPASERYASMAFRRCGSSGLKLPALALGLWHNFGFVDRLSNGREILRAAFDAGIVHWDLANNYGPPYGSGEENLGTLLRADFAPFRDELIISTKAGFDMWPGPYGRGGSRKYLFASLDQSLARMGIDYVDIFYHHTPDPDTPVEESLGAVGDLVRQGKALYAGISNYDPALTRKAIRFCRDERIPLVLHQVRFSLLERTPEDGLLGELQAGGVGCIAFSPLAQGLLTDRYLEGIPEESRAARPMTYLDEASVRRQQLRLRALNRIATRRGQGLAQMALGWLLTRSAVTSVLIGASSAEQLRANLGALDNPEFDDDTLAAIDEALAG
jgi:L-glyceraldehyde 3-phosphate reductase